MNIQISVQRVLSRARKEASQTEHVVSPSIFTVPSVLRDLSPSSFNPQLVSIGPFHREDENVQVFEGHKLSYLIKLMRSIKNSTQEEILASCMEKANTSIDRIKAFYNVWKKTYSDAEIAEMMVLDACFILGFLIELHNRPTNTDNSYNTAYPGKVLQFISIAHDLVLLENQIPMFFLYEIYECTILRFTLNISLSKLIHPVISQCKLFVVDPRNAQIHIDTTNHILSLLHQCYTPPNNITEHFMGSSIHSATDLAMAGVNFKPSKNPTWVMGMEVKQYWFPYLFKSCLFLGFWSKPTLTMPVLHLHDNTEFILRNLIAYEELFQTGSYVTSYASAIDMLVNTKEDVGKLIKSKVLVNLMGSNEEAANMINSICKNVSPYFYYTREWEKLNEYYDGYWPKHIARMRYTYFNSPWSIIALTGALILFGLQVVQTVFTILSYGSNK